MLGYSCRDCKKPIEKDSKFFGLSCFSPNEAIVSGLFCLECLYKRVGDYYIEDYFCDAGVHYIGPDEEECERCQRWDEAVNKIEKR